MGLRGDRQERIRELGKVFSNPETECGEIVDLYDWWSKHYDSVRTRFFNFFLLRVIEIETSGIIIKPTEIYENSFETFCVHEKLLATDNKHFYI